MPVSYERTIDPDIFLEIRLRRQPLSMSQLESALAKAKQLLEDTMDEVPFPEVSTEPQKDAIRIYNRNIQEAKKRLEQERDRLTNLIMTLKALPEL